MQTKKRYVVWEGKKKGLFHSRDEVQGLVSGVKGSKYKAFKNEEEAKEALKRWRESYYQREKKWNEKNLPFIKKSIAVDAACSSATGILEYQGIDLVSEKTIFQQNFPIGTNNIGEFLAIVHGLARLQKEKKTDYALYSDSKIAIQWVYAGKCRTNFKWTPASQALLSRIEKAELRLKNNPITTSILKWDTETRGEIPADFGRK